MKTRSYLLLILSIIVLATVFFLKYPKDAVEISYTMPDWHLPVDTSSVISMNIRNANGSVSVERRHGTWRHETGDRARADNALVKRLLRGVADFRLLGLVSSNPRKQDLFDVGESGTSIVITTDEGKEMSMVVGKVSSLPTRSYVRPVGSDMVYLASGLTPDVVAGEAFGALRQSVFRIDSASILLISIDVGQNVLGIHRQGGTWMSTQTPIPKHLMSPVLSSLQEMRAEQANESLVRSGDVPLLSVDVLGQKRVRMEFYSVGTSDTSYFLKTSSSPQGHTVHISVAQPFLKLVSFVLSQQAIASQPRPQSADQQVVAETRAAPTLPAPRKIEPPQPRVTTQPALPSQRPSPRRTTETSPPPSAAGTDDEGALTVHVVKPGETLESIARQYNTTREQIMQWNLLRSYDLRPGTELYVFAKMR